MHFQTFSHTVKATGNGSANRFVTFAGTLAGAASTVLGVAKTAFKTGGLFVADVIGVTAVEAGGAIANGAEITPDANGRAITAPEDATNVVGRAVSAASGAGDQVFILIR